MKNIFVIGPASVGKTTTGKLLADKLGHKFVDIDQVFCEEIQLIPDYIQQFSYADYAEKNSQLVDKLLKRHPRDTVFATPSGYMVYKDSPHLVEKHAEIINNKVISILLLPTKKPEASVDEIVRRQLNRWDDLQGKSEQQRKRYIERFHKYKSHGHIKIFSTEEPKVIADNMKRKVLDFIRD